MRSFTQEQQLFRQAFRKFLQVEAQPNMEQWREEGIVDRRLFEKAGEAGFLLTWAPEALGGLAEPDFRFEQIMIEESQYAMTSDWYATLHSRIVAPYIFKFGNESQISKYLPECVAGRSVLAIAMTEPNAGSDLAGIQSTAAKVPGGYVLNGSKIYISNGINADVVIVAAKTDPKQAPRAISLFIIERGMPGFERGKNLKKMGKKAQDTAELFFTDVFVPAENLLGEEGQGLTYLVESLAEERLIAAVEALSSAKKAFDLSVEFANDRLLFGKPLSAMQHTRFVLAELKAQLDMQQVYVDHCVTLLNEKRLTGVEAAQVKLLTTETLSKVVDQAVQIHGGAGYMDEYPVSRLYADARVSRIYAGSSEVMKHIIGKDIFSEEHKSYLDSF